MPLPLLLNIFLAARWPCCTARFSADADSLVDDLIIHLHDEGEPQAAGGWLLYYIGTSAKIGVGAGS